MTKEELRKHCEKQVKMCEEWAKGNDREPSGKIYEEHKLILDLIKALEQQENKEQVRFLYCNSIDPQKFIEAMECQPLLFTQHIISEQQPSDDCVSRQAVLDLMQLKMGGKELYKAVYELQPVTPTHGTCKDCKHWERIGYAIPSNGRCKHFDDVWKGNSILPLEHGTTENFYCADYEKRGSEK